MNVLILGCSFGVPGNGCPDEFHTENQLRDFGHTVHNFSICGAGNLESLDLGIEFIETNPTFKVDWLVWFHTELVRDMQYHHIKANDLTITLDQMSRLVYSKYAEFSEKLNCKIAIIGGAAPLYPTYIEYMVPDFCINSWFNEILNLNLPQIQTLSQLEFVAELQGIGSNRKLEILAQHEEILNALQACDDFPDNYHAGQRPHVELSKKLHKLITGG